MVEHLTGNLSQEPVDRFLLRDCRPQCKGFQGVDREPNGILKPLLRRRFPELKSRAAIVFLAAWGLLAVWFLLWGVVLGWIPAAVLVLSIGYVCR